MRRETRRTLQVRVEAGVNMANTGEVAAWTFEPDWCLAVLGSLLAGARGLP